MNHISGVHMNIEARLRKIIACCLVFGMSWSVPSSAADETPYATGMQEIRLARLMPRDEQIMLRNMHAEYTMSIPVSARIGIEKGILRLKYTSSIALAAPRSQLRISLNDQVIAQIPLAPAKPDGNLVDIDVPPGLLAPGYNTLKFSTAQHYTLQGCENPYSPELWTQINTVDSKLMFDSTPQPIHARLSELSTLIDRKSSSDYELNILTATKKPRDVQLKWGSLIAQAAALRLDYMPLRVHHAIAGYRENGPPMRGERLSRFPHLEQSLLAGRDNILVGTKAELSPYLDSDLSGDISNSYLAIFPLDEDPKHFLLVVSGRDDNEVTRAAATLAMNFNLPDSSSAKITNLKIPTLPPYAARSVVHENRTYQFSELGIQNTVLKGMSGDNTNKAKLEFWVPPDLFSAQNSDVVLSLHLASGAGLRPDSVLNIMLNDRFEQAIPLNNPNGTVYRDYKVMIPIRSFRPGRNTIDFDPSMMPLVSKDCEVIQERNLLATLFGDSTLSVPRAVHHVRMPDLALFSKTAFPYTVQPDGSDLAVHVADQDSDTIASAWMLTAKMAQLMGFPLPQSEFSFTVPQASKNLIVIGPYNRLDQRFRQAAPLLLGDSGKIPYLVQATSETNEPFTVQSAIAQTTQTQVLGDRHTAALQFESPLHPGKTVLAFTASNAQQLNRGIRTLMQPAAWNSLQGSIALWTEEEKSMQWQMAGEEYHVGEIGLISRLEYYFSNYPAYWIIGMIALIAILAVLTIYMLARFKRKHHPHVGDID